jgi:hypothetical protein
MKNKMKHELFYILSENGKIELYENGKVEF